MIAHSDMATNASIRLGTPTHGVRVEVLGFRYQVVEAGTVRTIAGPVVRGLRNKNKNSESTGRRGRDSDSHLNQIQIQCVGLFLSMMMIERASSVPVPN